MFGPEFSCIGSAVCPCGELCHGTDDMVGTCVAGDAGGGPSTCCTDDPSCGDPDAECVNGVCKPAFVQGNCWRDQDCPVGGFCEGASVCGCGVVCGPMDTPGTCITGAGGSGAGGSSGTCCTGDQDCTGDVCVQGTCEPPPPSGLCWSSADCQSEGPGLSCQDVSVCPCGGGCDPQGNTYGNCVAQPTSGCPVEQPSGGTPCTSIGEMICEYGSDIRLDCRVGAACIGGQWDVKGAVCPPLPGPGQMGCPADPTTASGHACATKGLVCDEGNGYICDCGYCADLCSPDQPSLWTCQAPPMAPCPKVAPDAGQACAVDRWWSVRMASAGRGR